MGMTWARLTDHDPGTRTPCGSKEEDVDSNEGDLGIDSGDIVCNGSASGVEVGLVETNSDTDDGNQELANEHTKGTPTRNNKLLMNRLCLIWPTTYIRRGRRPIFSMLQKEMGVDSTLTRVKMREMRKELEMAPVDSRNGVE